MKFLLGLKKSTVRRMQFKSLFQLMNDEDESAGNVLLPKLSQTRWLVERKLMLNILLNWEELKAYFACASQSGSQNVRYTARIISDMLTDDITYLYFQFATPVVSEFKRINASFQAANADPKKLFDDLNVHYNSLKSRVHNHKNEILP